MLRPLLFILAIALPVSAQCTQKIATLPPAPELLGFHLGMTKEEIKARLPQTVFGPADTFGVIKTTINPHFDTRIDQTRFEGVRSISLDLLDDRLTSLWIGYDDKFKVQTVDDFVKLISDSLKVSGPWTSWHSRGQQLHCADFQLIVSTLSSGPSLRVLDLSAEDTIAARRQAKEEQDSAAEVAAESDGAEPTAEVIGDKQSRTYYPKGCEPAKEISIQNRILFKTAEEAEKAGFKLAKNCH